MLQQKIFRLLIISASLFYSNILLADTCPDMSGTSTVPNGWIKTLGKPLSNGNQLAGAIWNVSFAGVSCVYNPYPSSTFVLVGLDPNLTPIVPGSNWQKLSTKLACNPIIDQACRCASSQYASCGFADSSNSKK